MARPVTRIAGAAAGRGGRALRGSRWTNLPPAGHQEGPLVPGECKNDSDASTALADASIVLGLLCRTAHKSPKSNRSLPWRGEHTASWSTKTVSTTRHISISCCQSRLLRANRGTSRAATAPTLPKQTWATMRLNPLRSALPDAERPRSSSIVSTCVKPSSLSRSRIAYCKAPLSRLSRT